MNHGHVLVTGANGFIGRHLCGQLVSDGSQVRATHLLHEDISALPNKCMPVLIEPIGPDTVWSHVLDGVSVVLHLAARVHVMHETSADPLAEFRDVNTAGTECLARQAAAQGVRRFVFMSTVGVNGSTSGDRSFTEADEPCPHNAYSQSKWEAENILRAISADTGMEVVILRAPLVYGPGNPGNFLALLQIVAKGLPLPFASVRNRRSLLYVGNLADALRTCAVHPAANGETFLVSDGEDVSTPDLIRCIASSLAVSARLFPFSPTLLSLMGRITGKAGMMNSLLGSLTVDNKKIRTLLGWIPPFSMSVGLRNTIEFYKHSLNR